jgi:CTP:molybdopterin cytidylyltransferase MocA
MMMILVGTDALLSTVRGRSYGAVSEAVNEPADPPHEPWLNVAVRIAAIVLAAGEGRRIGGPKALLPIGGTTFLSHLCGLYLRAPVAATIAVIGAEAERVVDRTGVPPDVQLVRNEGWSRGMLSSVWLGLEAAEASGAEAVLLQPVDHPLVGLATIEAVCAALDGGATIAVPSFEGRRGHPGGFAAAIFPELRAAPLEEGARFVLAAAPERISYVTGDAGSLAGIDTRDDYRRLIG